jgi:hypothetical protein
MIWDAFYCSENKPESVKTALQQPSERHPLFVKVSARTDLETRAHNFHASSAAASGTEAVVGPDRKLESAYLRLKSGMLPSSI